MVGDEAAKADATKASATAVSRERGDSNTPPLLRRTAPGANPHIGEPSARGGAES